MLHLDNSFVDAHSVVSFSPAIHDLPAMLSHRPYFEQMIPHPPSHLTEPVFVLTSDADWASEGCMSIFMEIVEAAGIVPMVFATHSSRILETGLRRGRLEVGLHPNFLPNSTHGASPDEVLSHLRVLFPTARAFRSHSYVESSRLCLKLQDAGFAFDSNLCLQGQSGLCPLHHWTGLIRYPVFWEDDIHWMCDGHWNFAVQEESFFTPGLKIINVHPFNLALNIPDQNWYEQTRDMAATLSAPQARALAFNGLGTATFLADLIAAVHRRGHRFHSLSLVHDTYVSQAKRADGDCCHSHKE